VSDLDRSIDWYRDALGFELDYRIDEYGWCELRTPVRGVTVGLGQSQESPKPSDTTPTWGVREIVAARGHLESLDVRFDGDIRDLGMVKLATFYDPDGNPWMLAESDRARNVD
jgi:catechol 2,3-dioxygenase-like lactoylglutathione lyase family enzyme